MDHPEQSADQGLEPTVDEQLRLGRFLALLDDASSEQLRQWCRLMAHQVLVLQPAAMRYLAREAARNLAASFGSRTQERELTE